jgi:hypothetical protein
VLVPPAEVGGTLPGGGVWSNAAAKSGGVEASNGLAHHDLPEDWWRLMEMLPLETLRW